MPRKSNTSQAMWIAIGSLFSNCIAIVSAMILSRYFDKEDYGTYKQVIYIYSTMQIVLTLGLPRCFSYFLPRLPIEQAKNTIKKITNIFYITGAIFACILFVGSPYIAEAFKNDKLVDAIRIYSPVALFLLPTLGLEGILATFRKSEYIAIYNTLTRVFMLVCIVLPVILFHGGYKMALWGFVVSSFITYILAIYLKNLPLRKIQHQGTTITYNDIWKFSLPLVSASIWGALINSTDQFFISRYFGTEAFANFSNGAIQLPFVGMVVASTSTILTPVFSKGFSENNFTEIISLWQRCIIKSSMILFPLLIFFIFFASPIMIVMYGEQYSDSAIFFQIKQTIAFTQIISVGVVLISMGATKFYSKSMMIAFILLVPFEYFVTWYTNSAYYVTLIHGIITVGLTYATFKYVTNRLKINLSKMIPIKRLVKITGICICSVLLSYLSTKLFSIYNNLLYLVINFILFCLIYLFLAKLFRLSYKEIINSIVPKKIK